MINKGEFNMSTNNYNSSLNVEKGNLNLISISSLNESYNIIFHSDLNGNIIPKDVNVWNWVAYYLWWIQNNSSNSAHFVGTIIKYLLLYDFTNSKNITYYQPYNDKLIKCVFNPVIKYIE